MRSLRIVLDTDRKPGWNEIDAVELLGPGGGQWAKRATASSIYASRSGSGAVGVNAMQDATVREFLLQATRPR